MSRGGRRDAKGKRYRRPLPFPMTDAQIVAYRWGERCARAERDDVATILNEQGSALLELEGAELQALHRTGMLSFKYWAMKGFQHASEDEA